MLPLDKLDQLISSLCTRIEEQVVSASVADLALALSAVSAARQAVKPSHLFSFHLPEVDIQAQKTTYAYDGLVGKSVALLSVNGIVIPRTKWAWSSLGSLMLIGYEFPENAVVELYYFA